MNYDNETIRLLHERKSVRVFEKKDIPADIKRSILDAACQAATAGNQQLYTILDITDQHIKDELVKTCDNQPFIASASMVLIFVADCKKWYDAYNDTNCDPRDNGLGDLLLAVSDANIAAANAVVAASSYGIGSCFIGDVMENCERQRKLLHLPEYTFPAAMLVFGYPTVQQIERKKPDRCPLDTIVSENRYPDMDKEYRRKMFENKIGELDYDVWMKKFCDRKFNSDFSKEMSMSVAEYLKQYKL